MSIALPKTTPHKALSAALLLELAAASSWASPGVEEVVVANGLRASIYSADYLRDRVAVGLSGSEATLRLDDGRLIPVINDINHPSIINKGDGRFHPFSVDDVMATLRALEHRSLPMSIDVYLLPYPRRGLLVSSTTGRELFLSPHVLDINPSVAAYIIAHELGHAFHNRFMSDASWSEYRRLRGIADESRFNELASHAYRPREIFAEDFRVLFGGAAAYFGGSVENPEIARPESVAGLEGFFVRLTGEPIAQRPTRIVATSYPNPFNPATEIRVSLADELAAGNDRVSVRVYSVTGALVRDLYQGRATGDFVVQWDGSDDRGNRVASSTYYAVVAAGGAKETLKLVLLK